MSKPSPWLMVVLDFCVAVLTTLFAFWLRFRTPVAEWIPPDSVPSVEEYLYFGAGLGLAYAALSWFNGSYRREGDTPAELEVARILRGSLLSLAIVLAAVYLYGAFSYSRPVFLILLILLIPAQIVARTLALRLGKTRAAGSSE